MNSIFDSPAFNQNLFYPRPDRLSAPPDTDEIYIPVEDSIDVHARRSPNPNARFSLLYFHGNGEIVSDYDDLAPMFSQLGCELTVADYRGYGKSGGVPTLRDVMGDAHKIYDYLKGRGKLLENTVVMGRSLGSASAIELCAGNSKISACVIESGYADPVPLVQRRGLKIDSTTPEEDRTFNNSKKISRLSRPLLIMHGAQDTLIYPAEAELNHREAGSEDKTLKILPGVGHNDIMASLEYFPILNNFFYRLFPPT